MKSIARPVTLIVSEEDVKFNLKQGGEHNGVLKKKAAKLLQQFSGFSFCQNNIRLSPLSALGLPCTIPVPAPLFLRGVYLCLGTLDCSAQRRGDTSPASIISGDGYSIVKVQPPDKQSFSH